MKLVACTRMYNVNETARDAWHELLTWVSRTSGIKLDIIDHAAPASLAELWANPNMAGVFMCGWPFSLARPRPQLLVAPIPAGERYQDRPIYFTDLVARRDKSYRQLQDTFNGRFAWTSENSHSGFNAPRHHFLAFRTSERPRLFSQSIGPVITPRGALAAVLDGSADLAPLDSYALDLMRLHAPDLIAEIGIIDSTAPAPIPPLVAGAGVEPEIVAALQEVYLQAETEPLLTETLRCLGLKGFARVEAQDYDLAANWAAAAETAGYSLPL